MTRLNAPCEPWFHLCVHSQKIFSSGFDEFDEPQALKAVKGPEMRHEKGSELPPICVSHRHKLKLRATYESGEYSPYEQDRRVQVGHDWVVKPAKGGRWPVRTNGGRKACPIRVPAFIYGRRYCCCIVYHPRARLQPIPRDQRPITSSGVPNRSIAWVIHCTASHSLASTLRSTSPPIDLS